MNIQLSELKGDRLKAGGMAGQKFNSLVVEGLIKNNCTVQTVSALPVSHSLVRKIIWRRTEETQNGVKYVYCSFINVPIIRQISLFLSAFHEVLRWSRHNHDDGVVCCYSMNISICSAARKASRIANVPIIGIITDVPGWTADADNHASLIKRFIRRRALKGMQSYDKFVFLTQQMNILFNPKNKPYIIMEGLVPQNGDTNNKQQDDTMNTRILFYAGQLEEKYGLRIMVKGFASTSNPGYRFRIYGTGSFVDTIKEVQSHDCRIEYMGLADNKTIVEEEKKADLLINIRPTDEEYTKYSFPSKNMEYMASGTPVLTSRLPGMPEEYYPYVYICDEENVEGVANLIDKILSKPLSELREKGRNAQQFVRLYKNNVAQTKRIIDFINQ